MMLEAALAYIARGWPVVPLHWPLVTGAKAACSCGFADCTSRAKHPIAELVRHGLSDASTDPDRVRAWWKARPEANVAIVLGRRATMFALDVDPRPSRRNPDAPTGDRALADLVRAHGGLGETLHAHTGGGGDHFFFRLPNAMQLRGKLAPGLDLKGAGGYVVAAPSRHESGGSYRWVRVGEALDAPAWLLEMAKADPEPAHATSSSSAGPTWIAHRPDLVARAERYLAAMPPAISGQGGHEATMRAAIAMVQGFELAPSVALDLLLRAFNPRCDPSWSRRELEHKVKSAERARRVGRGWLANANRGRAA
jgi:hypothetical protein